LALFRHTLASDLSSAIWFLALSMVILPPQILGWLSTARFDQGFPEKASSAQPLVTVYPRAVYRFLSRTRHSPACGVLALPYLLRREQHEPMQRQFSSCHVNQNTIGLEGTYIV